MLVFFCLIDFDSFPSSDHLATLSSNSSTSRRRRRRRRNCLYLTLWCANKEKRGTVEEASQPLGSFVDSHRSLCHSIGKTISADLRWCTSTPMTTLGCLGGGKGLSFWFFFGFFFLVVVVDSPLGVRIRDPSLLQSPIDVGQTQAVFFPSFYLSLFVFFSLCI